jgi:hypothetical protein
LSTEVKDVPGWYRIGVPSGTRLSIIVRRPTGWEIWTAVANLQVAPHDYHGTYLWLGDNGSVERVTRDELGVEDSWCIKEADREAHYTGIDKPL